MQDTIQNEHVLDLTLNHTQNGTVVNGTSDADEDVVDDESDADKDDLPIIGMVSKLH